MGEAKLQQHQKGNIRKSSTLHSYFPSSGSHTYNSLYRSYGILFDRLLLDTAAQDGDFTSVEAYSLIPVSHLQSTCHIDNIVRLGDARHLSVQLKVLFHTSIADPNG